MKQILLFSLAGWTTLLAIPFHCAAQSDDFNDGTDTGWTQYDPLATVGSSVASFSFPGGNTYRIQAASSTALAIYGPPRAASLREDATYSNFYVSVDVVNWDPALDQAFGILARVTQLGLGTTDGYAMTYLPADGVFDITVFTDEDPDGGDVPVTGNDTFVLRQGDSYRFVFIGENDDLTARVYRMSDLENPVVDIVGSDATYTTGICGLIAFDNSEANQPADVTYDNYFALDVPLPALSIDLSLFGDLSVSWPASAEGFILQGASNLNPPDWTNLPPPYTNSGGRYYWLRTDTTVELNKYYRLYRP